MIGFPGYDEGCDDLFFDDEDLLFDEDDETDDGLGLTNCESYEYCPLAGTEECDWECSMSDFNSWEEEEWE